MGWLVTADAKIEQDRVGLPLRRTVQAPHWAIPQPNFVPVRPTRSRMAQRRGIFSSASMGIDFPFMRRVYVGMAMRVLVLQKVTEFMGPGEKNYGDGREIPVSDQCLSRNTALEKPLLVQPPDQWLFSNKHRG